MNMNLSLTEVRVLGALIEKECTTPDQYPLSLNALVNACNQKSSRDPVMNLSESDVRSVLDTLLQKRLVAESQGVGSRVVKLRQRICNTEFGELQLDARQIAVLCVLMLRGPQTAGELRSRTQRMYEFVSVVEVDTVLSTLVDYSDGALITVMAKEPGRREQRYCHLLSGVLSGDTGMDSVSADRSQSFEQAVQAKNSEIESVNDSSSQPLACSVNSSTSNTPNEIFERRINALEERLACLEDLVDTLRG